MHFETSLITIKQLQENFDNPKIVVVDCTIDKVGQSMKGSQLRLIPNSLFFDIENKFSDVKNSLPHTLVAADEFTKEIQTLGIDNDNIIILYDRWGIYSSPRAWWMFKVMGFEQVFVLDGGLPAWEKEKLPVMNTYLIPTKAGNATAQFSPQYYAGKATILSAYNNRDISIIDARSQERFNATAPEPRAGLLGGHIPYSHNLPFDRVLDGNYYRSKEELTSLFSDYCDHQIYTCGSGVTASILAFASYLSGNKNISVYDGSWSEWGQKELKLPIER